eukprot:scaffold2034_cov124-Isochrysis_galbana.AAC.5
MGLLLHYGSMTQICLKLGLPSLPDTLLSAFCPMVHAVERRARREASGAPRGRMQENNAQHR